MRRLVAAGLVALLAGGCTAGGLNPAAKTAPAPAVTTVRPDTSAAIRPSLFGMHVLHGSDPWPAVPIGDYRLWDAHTAWLDLQPAPDRWDFTLLDARVALANRHGIKPLLTLGQTPGWASTRPHEWAFEAPGAAAEPRTEDVWRNYVRTVVTRYRGRIGAYEIWNEINLRGFWSGSPERLGVMTNDAAAIISAVDPAAVVVSGAPVVRSPNATEILTRYLRVCVDHVDVVGAHLHPPADTGPEQMLPNVARVRAVLASLHASRPVWGTETTFGSTNAPNIPRKVYGPKEAAGIVARAYLLMAAAGVQRLEWYAWDDRNWGGLYLVGPDGRPTAAATAYRETYRWLVGGRLRECTQRGVQWTCQLTLRDGTAALAAWAVPHDAGYRVPAGYRTARRLDGTVVRLRSPQVRLGVAPVLFTAR